MSFVFLDTSALINKAYVGIENCYTSSTVLAELEEIKKSKNREESLKAAARQVIHDIVIKKNINIFMAEPKKVHHFIKKHELFDEINDHKILAEAYVLAEELGTFGTFITSDGALFALAKAMTKRSGDLNAVYFELKEEQKEEYLGWRASVPTDLEMISLYSHPETNILDAKINEYIKIIDDGKIKDVVRWNGESYAQLKYKGFNSSFGERIEPRNIEQKMLFDLLQNKDIKVKLCIGNYGTGKAQPNDTSIPTPEGYKMLGNIKPGDYVFDRQGRPTKVLQVFPKGPLNNYKVIFSDGRISYCNNEHLWTVVTSKKHLKTLTLQEIIDNGLYTSTGQYRYKLPLIEPVQYPEQNLLIDPYVIGVLLGDGCCLEQPLTISSNDEFIVAEVAKLIHAHSYAKSSINNYSWIFYQDENNNRFITKDLIPYNELLQYSYDKSIPEIYKTGSITQRISLVQGLLDTDGSIDKKGRIRFCSTSKQLIEDLQEIIWSLGLTTSIRTDNRPDKYTKHVCYELRILGIKERKSQLFRLPRKKEICLKMLEQPTAYEKTGHIFIKEVINLHQNVEMTCLLVDNTEHLYLTEQYIPTHNTFLMLAHALWMVQKEEFDKIIYVRNNIRVKDTDDLGAMPGSMLEKMGAWLAPLQSHLGIYTMEEMINQNVIEPLPLNFIRGLDAKRTIIFADECEDMTAQHIQLLIGRLGEGSELFLAGDLKQTDREVFEKNSGIRHTIEKLKGNPLFGMVKLIKSERSAASALADLLD